jgi:phospholipid-transporting ATPase
MPDRAIITNIPDMEVCDNSINTSKYTTLNFVPKNLIVQFSKVANIYFLIIGIMQMIRPISVSGGFPVIFIPLSIVVGVSAIKDFSEDLKRKITDAEINGKLTTFVEATGETTKKKWQDVRIGNVIKV